MNFRKLSTVPLALLLIVSVAACAAPSPDASQESGVPEFEGVIAPSYEESEEWWPATYSTPPAEAPNVVILLLDDTGFAQFGSYGALIDTPNLDRLADNGLRFNNFHTVALCSPSRATIMAGRNPHSIGLGSHSLTAMGFPGYNAIVAPESGKSVAKHAAEERASSTTRSASGITRRLYEVSAERAPSTGGRRAKASTTTTDSWQPMPTTTARVVWRRPLSPVEDWMDEPRVTSGARRYGRPRPSENITSAT